MNKLFPILVVLILFLLSSCSYIEIATEFGGFSKKFNKIIRKIEKQVTKIERICKSECKKDEQYLDGWCDCMHHCMNSDDKWHLIIEGQWGYDNDFTTTTINNGSVNITLNECPADSTGNNNE